MEYSAAPTATFKERTNDNIESVRDLLFGKRPTQSGSRIAKFENGLDLEINRLEGQFEHKLDEIEELIDTNTESSNGRLDIVEQQLKCEVNERINLDKELRQLSLQAEVKLLERVEKLEARVQQFESKVLSELHARSKKQSLEIEALREEIKTGLTSYSNYSSDRKEISGLFIDLGLKLRPKD